MRRGAHNPPSKERRTQAPAALPDGVPGQADRIGEYYTRLRRRLQVSLIIAYLVPIGILSFYFHAQFTHTLKESGKLHLEGLAESQRNTVDLFLQERVVNILNLFHARDLNLEPTTHDMQRYLQDLRELSDAFVDVGFFDSKGVQIGYAGPHHHLRGKDYSQENWFQSLQQSDRNYFISDIYLGFRRKPHFTIAVRQLFDGRPYAMRATLDPEKFHQFLQRLSRDDGVDSALINRDGKYQIVAPDRGELLGVSDFRPSRPKGSGSTEVTPDGEQMLAAYSWLVEAPWALVVTQPLETAYAEMYRVRRIMIIGTTALLAAIITAIWLTTERLLRRAQATSESKEELRSQLMHASKLATVGELAAGVAHEINNPLAIISSESGLIRDMLNPEFGMVCTPRKISTELDHIDEAVFRAKNITQKLLSFVRKDRPQLASSNINDILDEVVGGFKERQFEVSNIRLVRQFDPHLPEVLVDPDQVRQVFLNIINNAGDAIEGDGTITLTTSADGECIRASIADTGKGMTSQQMERIFDPFFTTKEVGKGTGLGLSVSLNIVEAMGGRIEIQSMPEAGSSFTVVLPLHQQAETLDG